MNPYPNTAPIRGLLRVVKAAETFGNQTRALIGMAADAPKGTCRWCRQECEPRKTWHDECVRWYLIAKGKTVYAGGQLPLTDTRREAEKRWRAVHKWAMSGRQGPHPNRIVCVACNERAGCEIDHELALSVAWEMRARGDRRWWRAWTPRNLRWLCRECHAVKTADDRRLLARLRREAKGAGVQIELFEGGEKG